MDCPRCAAALTFFGEGLYEDIETHRCRACGGVFYPSGSLDRLDDNVAVNVERVPLEPRLAEAALRCPVGHAARGGGYREAAAATLVPSAPRAAPEVWLARCDVCAGFWLEGDALERLRAIALERSSLENQRHNANAVAAAKRAAEKEKKKG